MIIVADSSPLIHFAILELLDILDGIFGGIMVSNAVHEEVTVGGKPHAEDLKRFLTNRVYQVKNKMAVQLLRPDIDLGEAESIVLALEKKVNNILIDDHKGRRTARASGLVPIGTIGVLLQAKKKKQIKEIKPLLVKLERNKCRIGKNLYQTALELAGEL